MTIVQRLTGYRSLRKAIERWRLGRALRSMEGKLAWWYSANGLVAGREAVRRSNIATLRGVHRLPKFLSAVSASAQDFAESMRALGAELRKAEHATSALISDLCSQEIKRAHRLSS